MNSLVTSSAIIRRWKPESPSWKVSKRLQQRAARSGSRPLGSRPTGRPAPSRNAKRAHGFARRREEPTHRVEHARASCPDCGIPLPGGKVRGRRQIISIPQVRVTEHVVLERTCPKCRQRWSPEPDWSALAVGRQRVGISVQQEVCVLREECRLPYGVIQRYLKWRYRLGLSVGELAALVRGAAARGQEEYNRLQREIRSSPVVYGDETGWREDGRNGYLWSFSTPEVRYFLRRGSRGSKVVEEVLGDEFEGVLVSDFYGAYNVHQGLHQRCWTHLLRDIHQLKEKYPGHQGLAQWAQQVREVYDHAQAYPGPDPQLPETVQQSKAGKATTTIPAAAIVHLQALPGRRCTHEGAVPTGGTLLAGVVCLRR